MNPAEHNDAAFAARFPAVFRDLGGDPQHTCMAWGLEIPPAWRATVWALCETIQSVTENMAWTYPDLNYTVVADQIKEKFGGLRFYWHSETAGWDSPTPPEHSPEALRARSEADREIEGAVLCAERVIAGICDGCGRPWVRAGDPQAYPWGTRCTACEAHAVAEAAETIRRLDEAAEARRIRELATDIGWAEPLREDANEANARWRQSDGE